jgi:predicted transcriptional regulator
MKTFEELTRLEKSVLLIWGNELNFSTRNHRQIEKINKRIGANLPEIPHKDRKRINKTLLNSGFIVKHPTGRSKTYCLSPDGLKCCNIIKREIDI